MSCSRKREHGAMEPILKGLPRVSPGPVEKSESTHETESYLGPLSASPGAYRVETLRAVVSGVFRPRL